MFSRRLKTGYFVLEGLHSFGTVYYFYYLYFFLQKQFGFGNKDNLVLAALSGATYAFCCFFSGRMVQRGYFSALKVGFTTMACAMVLGLFVTTARGEVAVMVLNIIGMSFTWPTLEALVSEAEDRAGVQHMVGVYNVVWATTAAVANFTGGAMLSHLGLKSLFLVPLSFLLVQIALTFWLERQARPSTWSLFPGKDNAPAASISSSLHSPVFSSSHSTHPPPPKTASAFLRMAWLANPFAYIAINTLIAVMPGIALHLGLSTTVAGFCASVWCFSRLGAFFGLWRWSRWHYRFRWLLLAYIGLVGSFVAALLAPSIAVLVVAQLVLGSAAGLIYYSSLFYSMDLSDTKGQHGGFHEAAIGLGNFAGPAVGAAALQFIPQYGHSGALAVTLLLLAGLGGLATIWRRGKRAPSSLGAPVASRTPAPRSLVS
jgi:predicted MFS family arabinose efflux permease